MYVCLCLRFLLQVCFLVQGFVLQGFLMWPDTVTVIGMLEGSDSVTGSVLKTQPCLPQLRRLKLTIGTFPLLGGNALLHVHVVFSGFDPSAFLAGPLVVLPPLLRVQHVHAIGVAVGL